MGPTDLIDGYRRSLKRRNCSVHTVRNYMNILDRFHAWLQVPLEQATSKESDAYMDYLLRERKKPKTINCHFSCIHAIYKYLIEDERMALTNPVKKHYRLRLPRPLPKHLRDEQVAALFGEISDTRDRAMFMLMLRCGLRVEEVARLTADAIEYRSRQLYVFNGKGSKDRVVYLSEDALSALASYAEKRKWSKEKKVFLVQKGPLKGKPISVRGIQKRIEHYARRAGIQASCHHLRHTMATQLLNADADLVTIQDLLGHSRITTTQCYCRVSNLKVQRDYFKAIMVVLQRTQPIRGNEYADLTG
ncbi:MAG TPA: tyrosine-type recombinase/integrase [Thermodesulfovibrionales bacterium]|nr:tyrosine-type recombinase/integrase [Thermodesulfovibrionales bacterium]